MKLVIKWNLKEVLNHWYSLCLDESLTSIWHFKRNKKDERDSEDKKCTIQESMDEMIYSRKYGWNDLFKKVHN